MNFALLCILCTVHMYYTRNYFTNMTGFAKRGLIHVSNFANLRRRNLACS